MEKGLSTFGKEIYPGRELKILCCQNLHSLEHERLKDRFRIIFLKKGHATFSNGNKSHLVTSPAILTLNFDDTPSISKSQELEMDVIYFSPYCFDRYSQETSYEEWKKNLGHDFYYFRAFFERSENFIGTVSVPQNMTSRIQKLFLSIDWILQNQPDYFWPCRSRSYLLELLISINTIYSENESLSNPVLANVSDQIQPIVEWINDNYQNKIGLDDITRQFNTNKTTLNLNFKAEMGLTVAAYIISLRMQMACLLLKKTYLSVSEILERTGYSDEANFNRAFKKHTGTTPGDYRKQFAQNYF